MIVGKEYIGGNRWFLDFFFFTMHSCTDELSRQVVSKIGVIAAIRTFSLGKIYGILLCSHTSYYFLGKYILEHRAAAKESRSSTYTQRIGYIGFMSIHYGSRFIPSEV